MQTNALGLRRFEQANLVVIGDCAAGAARLWHSPPPDRALVFFKKARDNADASKLFDDAVSRLAGVLLHHVDVRQAHAAVKMRSRSR